MRLRLGRVSGIAIDVDISWVVIFAVVTYSLGAGYFAVVFPHLPASTTWLLAICSSLLFFGSVLVHELAHSVVAQRHGIEVEGISLFLFGGVARMRREPDEPIAELKMALAGPGASIALAVLFALLYLGLGGLQSRNPLAAMCTYLALINAVVVLFNMVPAFPLDGGRVLRALIWWRTRNLPVATRISSGFGQAFGILLIGGGVLLALFGGLFNGVWFVLVGWFLTDAARGAYLQTVSQHALSGVSLAQLALGAETAVPGDQSVQTLVDTRLGYSAPTPVPVLLNGRVEGLVGIPEVKRIDRDRWGITALREAMVPVTAYPTAGADQDAWETLVRMNEQGIDAMVLVDEGEFRGVVSLRRLLQAARGETGTV